VLKTKKYFKFAENAQVIFVGRFNYCDKKEKFWSLIALSENCTAAIRGVVKNLLARFRIISH